ncbi:MAG: arylsulfatase [Planctomycetaceae bacterium]|jgi:arylsulfatase A-like enzyme|nr:arylsulfatase [Planctomycetaceae bacterium]
MSRQFLLPLICAILCFVTLDNNKISAETPNIILILADDLGYGDVAALNPESKIKTPNLDALASNGMSFRDVHSPSSVCTPTRYGIITGRYCWRSELKSGVLGGYSKPLIEPERLTLASMLKKSGYHSAVIGKWHLGLDWVQKTSATSADEKPAKENIDFAKPFGGSPTSLGFDYFFGISASLDMPPFVYLENDHVVTLPTTRKKWVREGAAAEDFEAVEVLPKLTDKAVEYIESRAKSNSPFFLYFPLNAPHAPILPTPQWQGKSGINNYADFVMQVDDVVGTIVKTVERLGISKNTLIIFTSDNGCSPVANIKELREKGHDPSAGFRGMKADIFDGGHRVPFIVRWDSKIKAGSFSDQLGCLVDFMGTFAEITGQKIPDTTAEDTVSLLPALLETATGSLRTEVVHHSINGSFAIRQGDWKLCLCPDSGGWSEPKPKSDESKKLPPIQLYNMKTDPAETVNVQEEQTETVQKLRSRLNNEIIPKTKTLSEPKSDNQPQDILKKTDAAKAIN